MWQHSAHETDRCPEAINQAAKHDKMEILIEGTEEEFAGTRT